MSDFLQDTALKLNQLQDTLNKAKTIADLMQIIYVHDDATRLRNYLLQLYYSGYNNNELQQAIATCNAICYQCNQAYHGLTGKAVQDAFINKIQEFIIRNF